MAYRLRKHHVIERTTADHLIDVVREMVGIHAQVASSGELQLAARIDGLRRSDVQDALAGDRSLVKAWSMRGTLHLLTPEDLARIVVASGTRERWREAPWQKAYEVTFDQVEAMIAAVGDTLSDEPMLRADLADWSRITSRTPRSPPSCAPAGARSWVPSPSVACCASVARRDGT